MRRLPAILQNLLILFLAAILPALAIYEGTTNFSGLAVTNNVTVGGTLTVTGATSLTGIITSTAANVMNFANTGFKIFDTGGDHTISIVPTSNEAANRQVSIPALGGTKVLGFIDLAQTISAVQTLTAQPILPAGVTSSKGVRFDGATNDAVVVAADHAAERIYTIPDCASAASFVMSELAQTINGVKTFGSAPVLSTATLTTNGDTITFQDLGSANVVQSEGAQTINGVKTFGSIPVLPSCSLKRQVQRVQLSPATGACADATVYRGVIGFGRAGTVTRITYGTAVDPVSGTNVIAIEKNGFSGNTMLSTATVSLNGATANVAQVGSLTATGADLALAATDTIACEYNAGTQGTDAEQVYATIEFEPTDF